MSRDISSTSQRDPQTKGIVGSNRIHLPSCGSTNDEVLCRAQEGAPEGLVITADTQTSGRGRFGRRWESPGGLGLYMSVLLAPQDPFRHAPILAMMAALASRLVVEGGTEGRERVGVKWPNDVMIGRRKVGGVLCEIVRLRRQESYGVVVGVGVNVNQSADDFPEDVRNRATSLFLESGARIDRDVIIDRIIDEIDSRYKQFRKGSWHEILDEFRRLDRTIGSHVRAMRGGEELEGTYEGINDNGALLLRSEDGPVHVLISGEVTLVERS